jgi:hypothetical protein
MDNRGRSSRLSTSRRSSRRSGSSTRGTPLSEMKTFEECREERGSESLSQKSSSTGLPWSAGTTHREDWMRRPLSSTLDPSVPSPMSSALPPSSRFVSRQRVGPRSTRSELTRFPSLSSLHLQTKLETRSTTSSTRSWSLPLDSASTGEYLARLGLTPSR